MIVLLAPGYVFAQASQKATIEERLIGLEEGQKSIEKRLDDMNKRIDDLRADMISRIDGMRSDINNRIDGLREDSRFWLGLITTVVIAGFGGLFGLWVMIMRNLRQMASGAEGRAASDQRSAEFEEMKQRIATLEAKLRQIESRPA